MQFAGRFATSFTGFLITLLIARSFGPAGYGAYAKAFALVSFFFLFIDFGLNAVYIRQHKDDMQKLPVVVSARTFLIFISISCIGLIALLSGTRLLSISEWLLVLLFIPTLFSFGYYTTLNTIFQTRLRYDRSMIAGVSGGIVGLVFVWASVITKQGLPIIVLSFTAGYIVTFFLAYILARRTAPFSFSINKKYWPDVRPLLIVALPIGATLFLNTMYAHADVFVIGAVKGNAAVGIYQLAYKFFEFPLAFATLFANAIFPHYVSLYNEHRSRFFHIFIRATLALVFVGALFSLLLYAAAPFLSLVRPAFAASTIPLQILSLGYPIFFLTSALSWLLFLGHKEKWLILIYGASFILNVLLNIIFVPHGGYIASSWITIVGESLVLCALLAVSVPLWHTRNHAN